MHRLLVASLFLFAGQAVMADRTKVFEWRDAAGHASYSNLAPPPDAKGVTGRDVEARSFMPAQRIAIEAQRREIGEIRPCSVSWKGS